MIEQLKIALVQTDLFWEKPEANRSMLEEKIWTFDQRVDLIILPEMFSTGFSMDVDILAEPMNFTTTKWMKQMAAQTGSVITGSLIIRDAGNYFNRLLWVSPDGEIGYYDKKHLFRLTGEEKHFTKGQNNSVFELKGWKILPQICYDLRFPVWSRNTVGENNELAYDLVVYIASWPDVRVAAWDALLKARAIENCAYSIGVNRIGLDGNQVKHSGHSALYDYLGEKMAYLGSEDKVEIVELDYQNLKTFREKLPFWKDSDKFYF